MIWIYRILFVPVLCFVWPYYAWRMLRRGGYGPDFSQRFGSTVGLPAKRPGVKRIWLQAVSVGEMLAIAPLLEALRKRGDVEVYLTTTTSTGHKIAVDKYGPATGLIACIAYFPLDWWLFSARAWRNIQPDLVILMEGERWPEHLAQARKRSVPVMYVNARLSDRSFRRMNAWRWAAGPLMRDGVSRVLACSEQDGERFQSLGFAQEKISVVGNLKWDVTIPLLSEQERASLLRELGLEVGTDGLILLGSSTWPGEEAALVRAWREVQAAGHPVRLLLVPRHMERRGEVETMLEKEAPGLQWHFRSRGPAAHPVDIAVGDTTGELRKFTQLADLVFVGKSLPPHTEGQTPVEAAALGKAILFGPGMSNFREIARYLTAADAAHIVNTPDELTREIVRLFAEPKVRGAMTAASQKCHHDNQGAVARTVALLGEFLDK